MSFSHHVGRLDSLGSRFRGISEVWHPRASIQCAASMNVRPEKKKKNNDKRMVKTGDSPVKPEINFTMEFFAGGDGNLHFSHDTKNGGDGK